MGRVLTIIFGIIVLLVALLLIAPFFIDLNDYKAEIAAEVKEATGRDLAIDGNIELALLPTPSLAVSGVRFANVEGGSEPDMVRVGDLDVSLALAPLLSARIDVEKVRLNEPVVVLEVLADGRRNWELEAAGEEAAPAAGQDDGFELSLQNVIIANGTLIWRDHRDGSERRIENFSARLRADSLEGPFSGTVGLTSEKVPLTADFSVGRLAGNADLPVSLTGRLGDEAMRFVLGGTISDPQGTPGFTGNIEAQSEDIARIAALLPDAGALPAMPLEARAEIVVTDALAQANNLNLQLGESQLRGVAEIDLADRMRARLDLAAARVDADPWLAFGGAEGGETDAGAQAMPPLPGDFDAELRLAADIVTLRGDVLREVRFDGALEQAVVRIDRAAAVLPGASALRADGRFVVDAGVPRFTGQAALEANAFRRTLVWLGLDEAALPADRFASMTAETKIEAAPDRVSLSELKAEFDDTKLSGGAILQPGARLGIGARLNIDRIDLDAYLADTPDAQSGQAGAKEANDNPLTALDANIILSIGDLTVEGHRLREVMLDAGLVQGLVTLNEARIGDLGGAAIEASGTLRDVAVAPDVALDVALRTADANALMRAFGQAPVSEARLPLELAGTLTGGFTQMAVALELASGADTGTLAGNIADIVGTPNFDLAVTLDAADANRLLALAGQAPLGGGAVPLKLAGDVAGTTEAMNLDLALASDRHNIGARGRVENLSATPGFDLAVTLDTPNLNALMARLGQAPVGEQSLPATLTGKLAGTPAKLQIDMAGDVLGGSASAKGELRALETAPAYGLDVALNVPDVDRLAAVLGSTWRKNGEADMPVRLTARLDGDPDAIAATNLAGALGEMTFSGEARIALSGARPNVTAKLVTGPVPVQRLNGGGDGAPAGAGWSSEPIGFSALREVDGSADIRSEAILMDDFTIRDAIMEATLAGGVLTLRRFTGQIFEGRMDLTATLDARQDTADLAGTLRLEQIDAKDTLKALADFNRFTGPVDLTTTFSSRGASQSELVNALDADGSIAGTVTYAAKAEDVVGGILANVLSSQVKQVKGISESLNFIMQGFANKPAQLSGDYAIRDGVFSTRYIELISSAASARASGDANLGRSRMDMFLEMFRKGDAEPYNTVRLNGNMASPDIKLGGSAFRQPREETPQQQPPQQQPSQQPQQQQVQPQPQPEQSQDDDGGKKPKPKPEEVIKNVLDNLLKKKN